MKTLVLGLACLVAAQKVAIAEQLLNRQLIIACHNRDVDAVVKCLRNRADVNAKLGRTTKKVRELFRNRWDGGAPLGVEAWTPLLALAASNALPDPPVELWEELSTTWDPRRVDALRKQIPRDIVERRQADAITILRLLLSHGCRLDDHDGYGATALYMSAEATNISMARTLLEFGANPNTKTGIYIDGPGDTTPLHVACRSKDLVELLLSHGADASAKDTNGETPADWMSSDSDRTFDLVKTRDGWRVQPRK